MGPRFLLISLNGWGPKMSEDGPARSARPTIFRSTIVNAHQLTKNSTRDFRALQFSAHHGALTIDLAKLTYL